MTCSKEQNFKLSNSLGIVGGGQLGRMLIAAATNFGIPCNVLDPSDACPSRPFAQQFFQGSLYESTSLKNLIHSSQRITFEIEHFNADLVNDIIQKQSIESNRNEIVVYPDLKNIIMIQDKYKQKEFLKSHGFPLPEFYSLQELAQEMKNNSLKVHFPLFIKSKKNAYDGRGTTKIYSNKELEIILNGYMSENKMDQFYAESMVPFLKELSVIIVCSSNENDSLVSYPIVETIQQNQICHMVIAPAPIPSWIAENATNLGMKIVDKLRPTAGVFCIELFCLKDGKESYLFTPLILRNIVILIDRI